MNSRRCRMFKAPDTNITASPITDGMRVVHSRSSFFMNKQAELNSAMAFAVGDRRGPYQIISAIGKRGMGEVRKAMIRVARRYVAISYPCGRYEVISVGI